MAIGIVGRVALGMGARKAGGAAASALGSAVSGAFGLVTGLGRAAAGLANAASSAADASKEKQDSSSNVIYVNFGMAGSAGKQKVAGGGTLPGRSSPASPQVSEKMPTEALLDTAVKYLVSIDKSLKTQLELEKRSFEQQTRDAREASIESKPGFSFSDIKDRFSELKASTKENVGFAGTLAKYALILGAAGALVASTLDEAQLDALRQNIDQFKQKFGWLGELGAAVGAGGLMGFLFGGKGVVGRLKGGLVGMVAGHVIDRLTGFFSGNAQTDEQGNPIIDPQTGEPVRESRSMSPLGFGLSAIAMGMSANFAARRVSALRQSTSNMGRLKGVVATGSIRDLRASNIKGTSWLQSRRGRKFAAILAKRLGRKLYAKIAKYLARIVASILLTATGVGAVAGIVIFLANVAFLLFSLYDIATAIWDAWNESADEENGANVAEATALSVAATPDATGVSGPGVTGTTASPVVGTTGTFNPSGAMNTTWSDVATGGQNKVITGVVEGGRGYTTVTYSDGTTERRTGTLPARANNPGNIEYGPIAESYGAVGSSPSTNGPAVAVFPTAAAGFAAMDGLLTSNYSNGPIGQALEPWATDPTHVSKVIGTAGVDPNKRYTEFTQDEKNRFMQALAKVEGYYAAGSGPTMSPASMTGSSMIGRAVSATAETIGNVFGAIGGILVKPGIARNLTPPPSITNRIDNDSMRMQNDMAFGYRRAQAEDTISSPTIPGVVQPGFNPLRTISHIDPNYGNLDSVSQYLAHFRMAA